MRIKKGLVLLFTVCSLTFSTTAYCEDLDTLQGQEQQTQQGTGDESFDSITDYMRGYNAVTGEDMEKANTLMSPVSKLVGTLIGVLNVGAVLGVFVTTGLDILYLGVPFTRKLLNPAGEVQQGMPGGMGAMQMQPAKSYKLVSDEAQQALSLANTQGGGGVMPQAGGMGMGMGVGSMGTVGGMSQSQMPAGGKSVMLTYLKKRTLFLILFAVCSTILLSSLLLDCGLNLAQLLYKVGELVNNGLSNVQIQ